MARETPTESVPPEPAEASLRAATARQVTDFMARLFRGADPVGFLDYRFGSTVGQTNDPSVRQLLTTGVHLLEIELQDQLPVRSVLKTHIAQVFLSLGELDQAVALLQSAWETQSQLERELPLEEKIETLGTLPMARYIQGNYAESIHLFRSAVAACDEVWGQRDPRSADFRLMLGFVLIEAAPTEGTWLEGCDTIREVVQVRENAADVSPAQLAHAYAGLAVVERTEGYLGKAMLSLAKAGGLMAQDPRGRLYGRAVLLGLQATVNWQAGNKNELAYQQTQELLELVEQALGNRHPMLNFIQVDHARRMYRAGEREKAEALLRKGIASAQQAYGQQPRTAAALLALAQQLLERGHRLDEAETLALEAIEIFRQVLGTNHPSTVSARSTLETLRSQRTTASAAELPPTPPGKSP